MTVTGYGLAASWADVGSQCGNPQFLLEFGVKDILVLIRRWEGPIGPVAFIIFMAECLVICLSSNPDLRTHQPK